MERNCSVSRRQVLALGAGAFASGVIGPANAGAGRRVVVELFTSQGCSSCPPADKLLGEIRSMPGVLALTINVDYWDYLGWRDTLGDKAHTQRQYDYASSRGDMDVYTPQMVIDGVSHFVGSNRSVVLSGIDKARAAQTGSGVEMNLIEESSEITVAIGDDASAEESTVWLVSIAPKITVTIERGENTGRKIVYYNVARKIVPAGMWKGAAKKLTLPKKGIMLPDCTACVALLQTGNVGPIKAAASWGSLFT